MHGIPVSTGVPWYSNGATTRVAYQYTAPFPIGYTGRYYLPSSGSGAANDVRTGEYTVVYDYYPARGAWIMVTAFPNRPFGARRATPC